MVARLYCRDGFIYPVNRPFPTGTPRGKLLHELQNLQAKLDEYAELTDETTEALRRWASRFHYFLFISGTRKFSEEELIASFVEILQQTLIDPLTQTPLDEGALLGTDGLTYGHHSLALFMNAIDDPTYRHKHPLDPLNPAEFYTSPHPVVPFFVHWLRERDVHHPSSIIEEQYATMINEGKDPFVPTRQTFKRARKHCQSPCFTVKDQLQNEAGEQRAGRL